jgi:hypothetical protein
MRPRTLAPLELELRTLRRQIRVSAARLREATRALRQAEPPPRPLRLLRGGLWGRAR